MRATFLLLAGALASSGPAVAQANPSQPFAGRQTQQIKSLSPEEIDNLRNGRGMGFALPAELNGYPGPAHILEHAAELQLSSAQKAQTQHLFDSMKKETTALGEDLIGAERALDDAFASRTIDSASLDALTERAGAARAKVRAAHLRYHLKAALVLDEKQTALYARLRGYGEGHGAPAHMKDHPGDHREPGGGHHPGR